MVLKVINALLILFAVFMGIKQGWSMASGKEEMLAMFSRWQFTKTGVMIFGIVTILSSVLILYPKTFIWGNFMMAGSILLIICFHLMDKDIKGAAIELPFFLLNLIIIYLQHPLKK